MSRKFIGVVLMTLMLIAVIVVPGILGRYLGGIPVPGVHVLPRPAPGECVGPLTSPEELNSVLDLVPQVPCSQPHSAEILAVGVLDPEAWPTRPTANDASFTNGALSQQCDQLAGDFLGWNLKDPLPRIKVSFFTRLTVPGDLEWQLGQRWYSCEVMPGVLDYPISYTGTARDASFLTPPGAFATCSSGPGDPPESCDLPHHAEQLTRTFDQGSAVDTGTDNCTELAGKIIGTSDPTFAGRLAVLARVDGGAFGCWVVTTSSRNLTATLINHGSGPLPLR